MTAQSRILRDFLERKISYEEQIEALRRLGYDLVGRYGVLVPYSRSLDVREYD